MLHRLAKVELGAWQACLALAQSRLSRPDFEAKVSQPVQVLSQEARLEGSLKGLGVEIQDAGLDLIRLQLGLSGVLSTGAREVAVEDGTCAVTTSFKVVKQGAENIVVANLQDPNLSVSFDAEDQPKDVQAAVTAAIELWIRDSGDDSTFELFRFNSSIGAASGASFGDFAVTTAFARFAPQHPSFLVLMREATGEPTAADLVFDPHILPNGQTAVLWVREDLIRKTGGDILVSAAKRDLTFRPRAMNVELPHLTDAVHAWAQSIVGNVTLPEGLEFTSMEFGDAGLMLSATPLSVEELDALTARDLTQGPEDLVQPHAEALIGDCIFHHMKPGYRDDLLGVAKPKLPKEVIEVSKPQAKLYRKLGRLQVAQAIAESDAMKHMPFKRIKAPRTQRAIKKLSASPEYASQTGQLYALAFCTVRPRMSLYMEDARRWCDAYYDHITSPEYVEKLIQSETPMESAHEAVSKLGVLDVTGRMAVEAHKEVIGAISLRIAETRWRSFVDEMPDEVEGALQVAIEQAHEKANARLAELAAKTEPLSDDEEEEQKNAQGIIDAVSLTGSSLKLANGLLIALAATKATPENIQLLAAMDDAAPQAVAAAEAQQASARQIQGIANALYIVASLAISILFVAQAINLFKTEGMSTAEQVKHFYDFFAVSLTGFVLSVTAVGAFAWTLFKKGELSVQAFSAATGALSTLKTVSAVLQWGGRLLGVLFVISSFFQAALDFSQGKNWEGVVDLLIAGVSIMQLVLGLKYVTIALGFAGGIGAAIGVVLLVVNFILIAIRSFAFRDKEKEEQQQKSRQAADQLVDELARDGVALAA